MIVFYDNDLLLVKVRKGYRFPRLEECGRAPSTSLFHVDGEEAYGVVASQDALPEGLERMNLREAFRHLSASDYTKACKGAELVNFDRRMVYCPRCSALLKRKTEISKYCPECGEEYFPTLSPAIVVLVKKGESALLVHARNFSRPMFALVAGFVETGETLEQCVSREVREETGMEVGDIRYFGSQSWPFPSQLMVGFTAEWRGGELEFSDGELTDGGWFSRDNPPALPTPPSLSRRIIDAWLAGDC